MNYVHKFACEFDDVKRFIFYQHRHAFGHAARYCNANAMDHELFEKQQALCFCRHGTKMSIIEHMILSDLFVCFNIVIIMG